MNFCTVDGSGEEEGDLFDYIAQPEGKIGAKKMAKLEEKARKRAEREVRGLLFSLRNAHSTSILVILSYRMRKKTTLYFLIAGSVTISQIKHLAKLYLSDVAYIRYVKYSSLQFLIRLGQYWIIASILYLYWSVDFNSISICHHNNSSKA